MASSSMRQPEDVFVSVASPAGAGHQPGRSEGGPEALPGGARTGNGQPDRDGRHGGRGGADQDETTLHPHATRSSLRLDVRSQSRRRFDLGRGLRASATARSLLGQPVGKLRRCGTRASSAARRSGRQRPVRERRQLGDFLPAASSSPRRLIDTTARKVTRRRFDSHVSAAGCGQAHSAEQDRRPSRSE